MKTDLMRRLAVASRIFAIGFACAFSGELEASETIAITSAPRTTADFDPDWRFSQGDFPGATMPTFDDSAWRLLNLPHDWSSEGPFGPEYAAGTGFAPGGMGWYRKHFRLDAAVTPRTPKSQSVAWIGWRVTISDRVRKTPWVVR